MIACSVTLEGEELTMISWQSWQSAEEEEEAGPGAGAVSSVGVRSMSAWTLGGTGQAWRVSRVRTGLIYQHLSRTDRQRGLRVHLIPCFLSFITNDVSE